MFGDVNSNVDSKEGLSSYSKKISISQKDYESRHRDYESKHPNNEE